MDFTTIQAIRDHKFVGNHFSDSAAFNAIERFAGDHVNSIADRAEALRIMARDGMGLTDMYAGDHQKDEDLVAEFMREMRA